jgi:hypothetical protein
MPARMRKNQAMLLTVEQMMLLGQDEACMFRWQDGGGVRVSNGVIRRFSSAGKHLKVLGMYLTNPLYIMCKASSLSKIPAVMQ